MILKKIGFVALLSGIVLAPSAVLAKHPYPAERDFGDAVCVFEADGDDTSPDQSKSRDYGTPVSMTEDDSPFPDQSRTRDYGIRVSMTDNDSPFPDQSKSNDYGTQITV